MSRVINLSDYVSRKVMDRYFDKFTRKLVRMNVRIMETEAAWNRLSLAVIDLRSEVKLLAILVDGRDPVEEEKRSA